MLKVILKENVESLGHIGDLVRVSDGYARNFLLPRNLVVVANENNLAEMNHHKKSLEKKKLKFATSAKEIAAKIHGHTCRITRKVGDHQKIFGSVSASDLCDALAKAGIKLEKRSIHIAEPIKTLGEHKVEVRLLPEVVAELKISVVAE